MPLVIDRTSTPNTEAIGIDRSKECTIHPKLPTSLERRTYQLRSKTEMSNISNQGTMISKKYKFILQYVLTKYLTRKGMQVLR